MLARCVYVARLPLFVPESVESRKYNTVFLDNGKHNTGDEIIIG
jgi:hypothetical protein